MGPASLKALRESLEAVARPIEEKNRNCLKKTPVKSVNAGDTVKEDAIYYGVMMPALALFHGLRTPNQGVFVGIDIRSGRRVTAVEKRKIKSLRPLPNGLSEWAGLIAALTSSAKYWATSADLQPGGKLYSILAQAAMRNRQGKQVKLFRRRYAVRDNAGKLHGILPDSFLKLSHQQQQEVIDQSARAGNEPLSVSAATKTASRAKGIVDMRPSASELRQQFVEVVGQRLKTVPRN